MTQYDQVVAAIKALGGRGTVQQIFSKIDGIDKWGARNPCASIASLMSRSNEFTNENKVWTYTPSESDEDEDARAAGKQGSAPNVGQGLYLIVPSNILKDEFPCSLPFKVGLAHKRSIIERLDDYDRGLPLDSIIQELSTYEFPASMDESDYTDMEKSVRAALVECEEYRIRKCRKGRQDEWLEAVDLTLCNGDKQKIRKLVDGIVKKAFSDAVYKDVDPDEDDGTIGTQRASNRTFAKLNIPIKAELIYVGDDSIKCMVINAKNGVDYNGKQYTISGLTKELRGGKSSNGFDWFEYQGKKLTDM